MRWYLGLDLFDRVPDHSTISQLRRRKPSFREVFRRLFEEVVRQCIEKGLVSGRVVGADSSHVRANASRASEELVEVVEEAGVYWENWMLMKRWDWNSWQRRLERRCSPEYREALKLRQIWCEGTFAAQKRGHNLTRVLRRDIEAAENHCLLSAVAMNLKRMIKFAK